MRLPTALAVLLGLLVPVSAWAEPATKAPAEPAEVSEVKPAEARADDDKAPPARTPEEKPLDKKAPEQPKAPEEKPLRKGPEPKSPSTKPAGPIEKIKEEIKQKEDEFPSPAELMRKMKAERDKRAQMPKVVYFDLSEAVGERPAEFSLFGDDRLNLRTLVERLHTAKSDSNVKGILITLGQHGLGMAQAQEVRDALVAVKKSGKPVFVYADGYDTTDYIIASGASDVAMLEGGEIMIPGVGMEAMFARGLLDKVGVKADYVQIGEYKGADEQYTRTGPSEEMKGEMNRLVSAMYDQIVEGIATHRKLPRETVQATIDEMVLSGQNARNRGFVDHLIDQDGVRELMSKKLGGEVMLLPNYGQPQREPIDLSSPFSLLQALAKKPEPPTAAKPSVAVIYAEGVIVDGDGGGGLFSEGGVGSDTMRQTFRAAARDENVKAVVIRIDSPGGSALASEVMWQAARRLAAKKPVVISIGGMAASGGYYLASAGDKIYADNTAIVGSIGVVGGKFVLKDLFEKIGLKTESFQKGRNADLFSQNQPFTERQRTMVTSWMKQTYDQFTQRVMTTRKGKIKDIDAVARGRIFIASQAKELGMVDEIGGINEAIADAAGKGGLSQGGFDVKVHYVNGTAGSGPRAAFPFQPKVEVNVADGFMQAVPPPLRKALGQQLRVIQLLQDRPVVLVSPYTITIK
jgi:protease IV